MSTSKNIGAYRDIHELFLAAMERGGIELSYETQKAAFRELVRFNAYRRLLRELNAGKGLEPASEFDALVVRNLKDEEGVPTNKLAVEYRNPSVLQIRDLKTGEELKLEQTVPVLPVSKNHEDEAFLDEILKTRKPLLRK